MDTSTIGQTPEGVFQITPEQAAQVYLEGENELRALDAASREQISLSQNNLGSFGYTPEQRSTTDAYLNAKYNQPFIDAMANQLVLTAKNQATSTAINNIMSEAEARYRNNYNRYVRNRATKSGSDSGGGTTTPDPLPDLTVTFNPTDETYDNYYLSGVVGSGETTDLNKALGSGGLVMGGGDPTRTQYAYGIPQPSLYGPKLTYTAPGL